MTHLVPPPGYSSWLDYAVDCMDTRSLEQEDLWVDDPAQRRWPEGTTREQFDQAVRAELAELRENRIGIARGKFDLPDNAESNVLPPIACPGCGQPVGGRFIAFNAGALRRDGPRSASMSDDLVGFMHFDWHDHDQLGLPHVEFAENSVPGQIEMYFHDTACLRQWFGEIADRLDGKCQP